MLVVLSVSLSTHFSFGFWNCSNGVSLRRFPFHIKTLSVAGNISVVMGSIKLIVCAKMKFYSFFPMVCSDREKVYDVTTIPFLIRNSKWSMINI